MANPTMNAIPSESKLPSPAGSEVEGTQTARNPAALKVSLALKAEGLT